MGRITGISSPVYMHRLEPLCDCRLMRAAVLLLATISCAAADLEHRIGALLEQSPALAHAFVGVSVIDLTNGKALYRRNDDQLLLPASNMKVLTTSLALTRLGPEAHFETRIVLSPSGDLVLIGSGDPSLSGRVYPYDKTTPAGPPLQAIEALADEAIARGLARVEGDIIGDDRLYPWEPYAPGWTIDDAQHEYGAPVSALTINDNTLALIVHPGVAAGEPPAISFQPPLEYYSIDNRATTIGRGEAKLRISRLERSRQLAVWGSIAVNQPQRELIPIDDPALYAAQALYDALIRRGVFVRGKPVARHRLVEEDYDPPEGTEVARRESPPMLDLLRVVDKVSQNLHAELMLREVGRVTRHSATRDAGLHEMMTMLGEAGVASDGARLEDGSGLSRSVIVTPRAMTRVLAHMYASKFRAAFVSLLPVAGEDGTLAHRFEDVKDAGSIQAKTGSLGRALALSGYASAKNGTPLAFSILVNNFAAPSSDVRHAIDKIASSLLE